VLTLSRAGHCPMLYISKNHTSYVRPDGMGLGLGEQTVFGGSIQEATIRLQPGDVCVFYTDGITEAHHHGEEFGYERLSVTAQAVQAQSAADIKEEILAAVGTYTDHQANHDDLTLVVLKWVDNNHRPHQ
jgi:sigma-B regulation protein RsbU (phosphoserine phosphatase)